MKHTGDSSNIAWYADGGLIVEVLEAAMCKRNGKWTTRARPHYYFKVYRKGVGEVASWMYQPSRARRGRLSERTVAAQVRREVAA